MSQCQSGYATMLASSPGLNANLQSDSTGSPSLELAFRSFPQSVYPRPLAFGIQESNFLNKYLQKTAIYQVIKRQISCSCNCSQGKSSKRRSSCSCNCIPCTLSVGSRGQNLNGYNQEKRKLYLTWSAGLVLVETLETLEIMVRNMCFCIVGEGSNSV